MRNEVTRANAVSEKSQSEFFQFSALLCEQIQNEKERQKTK